MKFDIIEALRETLHTVAFLPFFVRLHSGERLRVLHSDFLSSVVNAFESAAINSRFPCRPNL